MLTSAPVASALVFTTVALGFALFALRALSRRER
jgi:multisubunit Na+/H+ antiporter MnhC subunit